MRLLQGLVVGVWAFNGGLYFANNETTIAALCLIIVLLTLTGLELHERDISIWRRLR